MHPAFLGLITIILGVGGCIGYFWASNFFLDKVLFPPRGFVTLKEPTHTGDFSTP